MIAAIHFRDFKALRSASVRLGAFNLLVGPSGSGKTSLLQAILRLRTLAAAAPEPPAANRDPGLGPRIVFDFAPPFEGLQAVIGCEPDELVCNLLTLQAQPEAARGRWPELRARLGTVREYLFDHFAMGRPAPRASGGDLASNAGNIAAVLAEWREHAPATFATVESGFRRLNPEFAALDLADGPDGTVALRVRTRAPESSVIPAENLAQGTLYSLAILTLAAVPRPPAVVCLEEADRGFHPRLLRAIRDELYRLSHPGDAGLARPPAQVVVTSHSPYLLDLFKDHPEEVILAQKSGSAATFRRLSEVPGLGEHLREAHLGDLWYSGVLGGVPGE